MIWRAEADLEGPAASSKPGRAADAVAPMRASRPAFSKLADYKGPVEFAQWTRLITQAHRGVHVR